MPALTSFSVNDRESTPAAHLFTPRGKKGESHIFMTSAGVPIGNEKVTVSTRDNGARIRSRVSIAIPVVQTETINGIANPKVVRTAYAVTEYVFDKHSSEQERKNLITMLNGITAADALVDQVLVDAEDLY